MTREKKSRTTSAERIRRRLVKRLAAKMGGSPSTSVQSLLFSKRQFPTAASAKAWAVRHGFLADDVDDPGHQYFHLRQRDPEDFVEGLYGTIPFGKSGIMARVGHLKRL